MEEMSVLVVEDEPALRRLSAFALQRAGCAVLQAANAEEALRLSRTGGFAVLVTDTHLGDGCMDGFALADRIAQEHPGIPVIIMSGQPRNGQLAAEKGLTFLAKPFLPGSIVQYVRRALDGLKAPDRRAQTP